MANKQSKASGTAAGEHQETFASAAIQSTIRKHTQNVYELLDDNRKGIISLRMSYRGPNDWLAVGKRYGTDGKVEVIFGSGPDFAGCLIGLEVAIEQDKWRPDKYLNK